MENGNVKELSSDEDNSGKEEVEDSKSEEKKEKKEKKLLNKKRNKKEKEKNEDGKSDDIIVGNNEVKFLLDNKKRVTVHKFKGQLKVDIREFYDDNGEMKPGKRGISLSLDNWTKLKKFINEIDESIDNMK